MKTGLRNRPGRTSRPPRMACIGSRESESRWLRQPVPHYSVPVRRGIWSIIGTVDDGHVGSPAITVTGGWVWVVVGVGDDVVVEQLDISRLLSIAKQIRSQSRTTCCRAGVDPVLTATINGPLWVAGGEDLWALNPSTGAIETEFNTRQLDHLDVHGPDRESALRERAEQLRHNWWSPSTAHRLVGRWTV